MIKFLKFKNFFLIVCQYLHFFYTLGTGLFSSICFINEFFIVLFFYYSSNSIFLFNKFQQGIISLFQFFISSLTDSLYKKQKYAASFSFFLFTNEGALNHFAVFDATFICGAVYVLFIIVTRKNLIINVIRLYVAKSMYKQLIL